MRRNKGDFSKNLFISSIRIQIHLKYVINSVTRNVTKYVFFVVVVDVLNKFTNNSMYKLF